ncbi:MAG: lytic transglycosylase domain-containing protein [Myxococcales bacterium]|nr:lytic transglycosylase domain-containing protein [Myxococcales bacterium]
MTYSWRTLPSGAVEVDGKLPELTPAELYVLRTRVMRWRALAEKHSARTGVPVHWLLGVIFAETGGVPTLTSQKGAFGLMQVMPFNWGGRSKAEMSDPDTNILVGSNILAGHIKRMGRDLPKVASGYNAGAQAQSGAPHPSAASPWGMRENRGYISNVVAGANSALRELAADPPKVGAPQTAGRSDAETGLALSMLLLKVGRFL